MSRVVPAPPPGMRRVDTPSQASHVSVWALGRHAPNAPTEWMQVFYDEIALVPTENGRDAVVMCAYGLDPFALVEDLSLFKNYAPAMQVTDASYLFLAAAPVAVPATEEPPRRRRSLTFSLGLRRRSGEFAAETERAKTAASAITAGVHGAEDGRPPPKTRRPSWRG